MNYDTKHIKNDTTDRANNPQRRSTCFGFYCLLPLLSAVLVSSFIPCQIIARRRTNSVI